MISSLSPKTVLITTNLSNSPINSHANYNKKSLSFNQNLPVSPVLRKREFLVRQDDNVGCGKAARNYPEGLEEEANCKKLKLPHTKAYARAHTHLQVAH